MGDNNGRVKIIDPNNFDYKYNKGIFDANDLNMSVPNEDLSIIVELKTNSKSRTILNTNDSKNSIIDVQGQTIRFIDGTSGKTTGYQNYLTTQYTELGTQLDELDESLGITNIDIDFNSSYAPIVNINFVDVKGGALFQSGGQSKYNVLFRLPYPLFELKVKGFYGLPVTYCLHMVKSNIRFNSQTGNFEIAAQFVGYTYAMLSDMIIGYLKGAVILEEGKALLSTKKTSEGNTMISINQFIQEMGNIDGLIKEQLTENNDDTNNLAIIKELTTMINQMKTGIKDTLSQLQVSIAPPTEEYPYITIIKNPTDGDKVNFLDRKNYTEITPTFDKNYIDFVNNFNEKAGNLEELKLKTQVNNTAIVVNAQEMINDPKLFSGQVKTKYGKIADVNNSDVLNNIINRLKGIAKNVPVTDALIKFYDYTEIGDELDNMLKTLKKKEEDVSKLVAENLGAKLKSKLGFDPTIRNTIMLLTSHVEVFLDLLFEVSSKYKDSARVEELKKFETINSKSTNIDVKSETIKSGTIYPWPEYIEDGVEKYLGSKKGPLKNPLNVPEIKFVEELYQAMITVSDQEADLTANGPAAWNSFAPIDSYFYIDKDVKSPYDRLDTSARPDDIVRLIMLRAAGFIGFSNNVLTPEEIQSFATSEANLVLKKFNSQPTVLQAINKYTVDKFTDITGVINGSTNKVLTLNNGIYEYTYLYDATLLNAPNDYRYSLPVDRGFNNVTYTLSNDASAKYLLTSYSCQSYINSNIIQYIDFIDAGTYDGKSVSSPSTESPSIFSLNSLKSNTAYTPDNIKSVGFLANNGKYGVQEYRTINYENEYGVSNPMNFFSLFYDSSEKYYGGISEIRNGSTTFSLGTTFRVFEQNIEEFDKSKELLFGLHKDCGNTILNLSKGDSNSQLSYPFFNFGVINGVMVNKYSLFTSRFYNAQTEYGRAFLFLQCFPWRGLIGGITDENKIGVFRQPEILNIFKYRTGFIQVPELFPAFIGSLLWRYELGLTNPKSDIVDASIFPLGIDPIIFNNDLLPIGGYYPSTDEYMKTSEDVTKKHNGYSMCFYGGNDYPKIEDELLKLPDAVKKQFIDEFIKFVTDESYTNSYKNISKLFEIIPKSGVIDSSWVTNFLNVNTAALNSNRIVSVQTLADNFTLPNGDTFNKRYSYFNFMSLKEPNQAKSLYNFYTEFKDDSAASNKLKELLFSYKYIANNSWYMWDRTASDSNCSPKPKIKEDIIKIYISKFLESIKTSVEEKEKAFYSNNDNEQVKLEIYRTLKKIYDKWIADTSKDNAAANASKDILFQCCKIKDTKSQRLSTDEKLREKRQGTELGLIDSFRFLTRAYKDIGDVFQINPLTVSKILLESGNNSFYDVVGRILNDNNFEFIALPNFIDYTNIDTLREKVFRPYPYYEVNEATTGPSFVCMYVGQTSTKLDFGPKSEYPDDGFNFTEPESIPDDFTSGRQPYEDTTAAFIVRYGQQNQNIFKDVTLDTSEFNETAESINVTDAIANRFSQASQTYVGQNLYNIYSIRSYKVEVEMMGDAMIQPMMYFQLDNIPMFRGAYLITKVKHNIKPNYMSTSFTGTRINKNQTGIIDISSLFSSMLNGYELPKSKPNSSIRNLAGGKFPPIVITIMNNGGRNGDITIGTGNINLKPVPKINGVDNTKINAPDQRDSMLDVATDALVLMLNDFVAYAKQNNYPKNKQYYIGITSLFRGVAYQQSLYDDSAKDGSVARPGRSNHGWGIAVDLAFVDDNGNYISNSVKNKKVGFDLNKNKSLKWFLDNSYAYGFIIPWNLRAGKSVEEFWHFEYHGTSARCLLAEHPDVKGYVVKTDKAYKSIANPKEKDGKRAVYSDTDCKYIDIETSDGSTEFTGNNGSAATGCKSPNYTFTFADPLPPRNELTYSDAIKELKKLPEATGKAVFAILFAEASKNENGTAFRSVGGFNYAGVQTDGNKWGAPGITGQFCKVDSGRVRRAFAIFDNNDTFLTFMADRVRSKGINGTNGDSWVTSYIRDWWSPANKESLTKGTQIYEDKLAIYNSAMRRWNKV